MHRLQADKERLQNGFPPVHLLQRYGQPLLTEDSGTFRLALKIEHTISTLITLELAADDVRFVSTISPGMNLHTSLYRNILVFLHPLSCCYGSNCFPSHSP